MRIPASGRPNRYGGIGGEVAHCAACGSQLKRMETLGGDWFYVPCPEHSELDPVYLSVEEAQLSARQAKSSPTAGAGCVARRAGGRPPSARAESSDSARVSRRLP